MGVHGLWKLIEPCGQMVPLESLAGKVLAVDVSIWLHQAVKGMQDTHGAPLAVAHLLILFHRVCKLLFYKIKPVFVFDGGVPALKSQTMAARRQRSTVAKSEAVKVREKLIKNLLKHEALRHVLSDEASALALGLNSFTLPGPSVEEDLYKLPPAAADFADSESSDAPISSDDESEKHVDDIHSIDVTSQEFLSLPAEVRHDILTELIETRKQSSWKYLDSMPKKSDSFSDFQMNRLLKRHAVQTSLEKAGKEMGGRALSLKELESLLGDQGVLDPKADLPSRRIAQDNTTRYILIQKESEGAPEQKEGDKFDIMNRLEDVEWSSESDTDIILQKSPVKQKRSPTSGSTSTNQAVSNPTENEESCSISKQPKVRITEEIADILSVLEDQSATKDVKLKIENLQSKIHFQENSMNLKNEPEEKEVNNIEESKLKELIKDPKPQDLDLPSENPTEASKTAAPAPAVEVAESDKQVNEEKVLPEDSHLEESKKKDEPEPAVPPGSVIEDSTDSEADFIPVMSEDFENGSGVRKEKESGGSLPEVPAHENEPLTLTINTSELGEKDDMFADVFEPVESKETEKNAEEIVEGETASSGSFKDSQFIEEVSKGDLNELKKNLEQQHSDFLKEKGKQDRLAVNLTDQVYTDAQEMLRLFGIPFVIAPMEAEAQCATLNAIGLTEGTITDDSDIWLFGGQVVYKNFFNQQKHVLEYRLENIQKCFILMMTGADKVVETSTNSIAAEIFNQLYNTDSAKSPEMEVNTKVEFFSYSAVLDELTREEMVKMALLVGSDYTTGLAGVGPVTALEIMAAFQTPKQGLLEGLLKFRDWFTGATAGGPPRATLRRKIRNVVITPGFPNRAVVEAYLNPMVDDSREPFSWAKPNLELIRKYVRAKLGWPAEKCNDLLMPVLKKLEENTSQTTLEKHFKIIQKSGAMEAMLSKRVENAVKRLGNSSVESDDLVPEVRPPKKRKNSSAQEESTEGTSKSTAKSRTSQNKQFDGCSRNLREDKTSKIKLINEKLHRNAKVPQREMAQKALEEKKKEAIKIFRTYKKGGKKKTKVFAKEEIKLSESSSEDD